MYEDLEQIANLRYGEAVEMGDFSLTRSTLTLALPQVYRVIRSIFPVAPGKSCRL